MASEWDADPAIARPRLYPLQTSVLHEGVWKADEDDMGLLYIAGSACAQLVPSLVNS